MAFLMPSIASPSLSQPMTVMRNRIQLSCDKSTSTATIYLSEGDDGIRPDDPFGPKRLREKALVGDVGLKIACC